MRQSTSPEPFVSDDREQLQELIEEARALNARLGHSANGNGGQATITVNMPGGWAAVACAALAAVCFYIAADARSDAAELRAEARDLGRKVERREDYLNMLWQRYPELRPEKLQQEDKAK